MHNEGNKTLYVFRRIFEFEKVKSLARFSRYLARDSGLWALGSGEFADREAPSLFVKLDNKIDK